MCDPWTNLLRNDALLAAAGEVADFADPATVARLRKHGDAEQVRLAIELTRARRKAAEKFDQPDALLADVTGVEQASSMDVARHKAARFIDAGVRHVLDLCCGIGGDAMGLTDAGIRVTAVDRDPNKAAMAQHNARCDAVVADVTTLDLDALSEAGMAYHIDPDRRAGHRRQLRYEDYQPGPAFIEQLARYDGAVKLSPAVAFDALPGGEIEIINRRGTLVQAVLWTGTLAQHARTAPRIDPPTISLHGEPDLPIPIARVGRFIHAIDPAIERARMIGALCHELHLGAVHPQLGLLASDGPTDSPWLVDFELIETMPWRVEKVRQWLAAHGAGIVEVKTRGKAVDPDIVQKQLRGKGDQPFTVFVLRFDRKMVAWITRRLEHRL